MQDTLVHQPLDEHLASVIWLHGLGADAFDFADLPQQLGLADNVRFLLPNAPVRRVTMAGGMGLRSWYDILAAAPERVISEKELAESVAQVHALIEHELESGIPAHRIVLGGFSQGGAVAWQSLLTSPWALGGLVALSTYIASPDSVSQESFSIHRHTPMLVMHGLNDDVVPLELGEQSIAHAKNWGFSPQWHALPGLEHEVAPQQLEAIGRFLLPLVRD
ncbi:alpha/beta hydrolase [Pokkaliibacter sp. CJK22405]|uniref:alpha/beta hydrolase n=1 Tax=Pokkaliibacter sp. CJK22405 TaxID=3384615 RepID=UPI003984E4DB